MDWVADLLTFITSQTGKAVLAIGSLASSLLGAGYWIGNRFGQGKLHLIQTELETAKSQRETVQTNLLNEQLHTGALTEELNSKRKELEDVQASLKEAEHQLQVAKRKLVPYYQHYTTLKPLYDQLQKEHATEKDRVAKLTGAKGEAEQAIVELRNDVETRQVSLDLIERRTQRALKLQGNLWAAKALQAVPKFRPLADRQRAIISVLNLKGGVGKTTITSQLGIALANRGYRVLLIDLDFQGSLTQMFIPQPSHKQLAHDRRLVHHFLDLASNDKTSKLLDYAQQPEVCVSGGKLGIIAASDDLAYTELNLTLRWLLRRGERDNRFLLRKALHMKSITKQYDIVLLDCPPIVNISCINALAASDYLLIPVTLNRAAVERVPVLLKRFLRDPRFLTHINQHLRVLGLVANRTHRDAFTGIEREDWKRLATWCRDVYGQDVKQFQTVIQQLNSDVHKMESLLTNHDPDSKLSQLFAALAAEVEQELPNECRRGATALS
jgi:cellulose biosynthesis protein BcsQ